MARDKNSTEDHDLLIELRTQMIAVRDDIKKLSDTTVFQLGDHEVRLRKVEKSTWSITIIATVAATIVGWLSSAVGNGLHL